jgi:hypothetical protein
LLKDKLPAMSETSSSRCCGRRPAGQAPDPRRQRFVLVGFNQEQWRAKLG